MEMKEQIRDLLIQAIEADLYINKTEASLILVNDNDEMEVKFDLIVSVKSVTLNGETQEV